MKKSVLLTSVLIILASSCDSILGVTDEEINDIKARLDCTENRLKAVEDKLDKMTAVQPAKEAKKPTTVDGITLLNTKAQLDQALGEEGAKVIKITTEWCSVCKMMAQDFADTVKEFKDTVKAYEIDGDNKEFRAFQRELQIAGYPTVVSFPNKKQLAGNRKPEVYRKFFADAVKESKKPQKN